MEHWRNVVGYEGYYQVSDQGRIRSVDRVVVNSLGVSKCLKEKILRQSPAAWDSSLVVTLPVRKTLKVHHIVLEAWISSRPSGYIGCHKDDDINNNFARNLYWGTKRSNALDAIANNRGHGRPAKCIIRSDGVKFDGARQAAEDTGTHTQSIYYVCNGHRKTAGGYGWKYA